VKACREHICFCIYDVLFKARYYYLRQLNIVGNASLIKFLENPLVPFFALNVCEPSCKNHSSSEIVDSSKVNLEESVLVFPFFGNVNEHDLSIKLICFQHISCLNENDDWCSCVESDLSV
jgi:hypothetical protein